MRRLIVSIFILAAGCGPVATLEEMYPGKWREPTGSVAVTLGKNRIRGCGEFYQKENVKHPGEYAVACTHNPLGQLEWNLYLVWPAINKATGPDPMAVWQIGEPPRQLTKDDL